MPSQIGTAAALRICTNMWTGPNTKTSSAFALMHTSALALATALTTLACAPMEGEELAEGESVATVAEALSTGTYEIKPVNSGKCLDLPGGSTADGEQIKQWGCNGGSNQRWNITDLGGNQHRILAVPSGKGMNVYGGNMPAGAKVKQWPWGGSANEKWWIDAVAGGYVIKPTYDGNL